MKIGRYTILRQIAKGGMGEVLLVFDPISERSLALKRIRDDLKSKGSMKARFLREARLTAQLTHPGIISIYEIHVEEDDLYYTMPYVEGKSLKQLLKDRSSSIPSLISIFKSICQTVSYTYTKGILHRDLKPENVLIGNFGEVIVLDWGLSEPIGEHHPEIEGEEESEEAVDLTRPGKIVGTLAFLSPERALGAPSSVQSEIYALGVILYLILTLRLPFERHSLKEFRENWRLETLTPPEEIAPYRDVPPRLSHIAKKCLSKDPADRYDSFEALLSDLSAHMEGRSEWYKIGLLTLESKSDWEFQENLLLTQHSAIAQEGEWVGLSLSKMPFEEPLRLKTAIELGAKSRGIGFLLNVPETSMRASPFDGYCLWIAREGDGSSTLFRNGIKVMQIPDLFLKPGMRHQLILEKGEKRIRFFLDGSARFTYMSYLPLFGDHVGVISRDADFTLSPIAVFSASREVQVSCLAVPEALLANRDYKRALIEYRRIAASFPGQLEGRSALFRAGITLLEEAKATRHKKRAKESFGDALEEFSKLHNTPGAPLEYLGKSLVYAALSDREEEVKCLELALRRYPKHPLIAPIKEQILYRMHESASRDRYGAYKLILVALRHIPDVIESSEALHLFKHILKHAERPFFLENPTQAEDLAKSQQARIAFEIELAFWAALPLVLVELFDLLIIEERPAPDLIGNIIYALFELGAPEIASGLLSRIEERAALLIDESKQAFQELSRCFKPLLLAKHSPLKRAVKAFLDEPCKNHLHCLRTGVYLMQRAIFEGEEKLTEAIAAPCLQKEWSRPEKKLLDSWRIWSLLKSRKPMAALALFEAYSEEELLDERSLLFPLYGCFLYLTENDAIFDVFFTGITDTPFPGTPSLLAHELIYQISKNPAWYETAFLFEKRMLYRELLLLSECQESEAAIHRFDLLQKEQNLNL